MAEIEGAIGRSEIGRQLHETGFTLSNQVPTPDIYGAHCRTAGGVVVFMKIL